MSADAFPVEEHTHEPDELRRILAYRLRFAVTIGPTLSLRKTGTNELDTVAIAMEQTLRDGEGLPSYIAELDAPPELRSPEPWRYCNAAGCSACVTALAAHLPRLAGIFSQVTEDEHGVTVRGTLVNGRIPEASVIGRRIADEAFLIDAWRGLDTHRTAPMWLQRASAWLVRRLDALTAFIARRKGIQ